MYKFTNQTAEINNVDIDMRYESDMLTNTFGIDILYVRNCKFVRCSCFDDLNKVGDSKCPKCLGNGHFASIEKIKAIESSNSAYSSTSSVLQTPIGQTDQKNEIYYIRHNFTPKERDVIIKVTWDKHNNPVDIVKILEIINVYEMRGDNGRMELTGCVVQDRTDLVRLYRKLLSELSQKGLTQLSKGGRYIWPALMLKNEQN